LFKFQKLNAKTGRRANPFSTLWLAECLHEKPTGVDEDRVLVDALILARAWLTELSDFDSELYEAIDEALLSCEPELLHDAYALLQERAA